MKTNYTQKTTIIYTILILATFFLAFYGKQLVGHFVANPFSSELGKIFYYYSWWLFPIVLIVGLLFGFKNILVEFRIHQGFTFGLLFSFITVSPMFISSAIIGHVSETINTTTLLHHTVGAGFMEELLFRAFLFGILFRRLQWGFIPAAVLGAVIFGLGHIYQGTSMLETAGVFAVTFLGAAWFAWLFIEWDENLWIPIFLHTFMNLSWILFDVSHNALGGLYSNIFRVITIAVSITLTVLYQKGRSGLVINRKNLWVNRSVQRQD